MPLNILLLTIFAALARSQISEGVDMMLNSIAPLEPTTDMVPISRPTIVSVPIIPSSTPLSNRNAMRLFFRANPPVLNMARVGSQLPMPVGQKRKLMVHPTRLLQQHTNLQAENVDIQKRLGPVARNIGNFNAAALPCCRDRFGEQACQSLRKSQPATFEKRCLQDHDFHTIDCCLECRRYIENNNIHPDNARAVQRAPVVCRDKHSISFCRRFKESGLGKYSCKDTEFAIRVCRSSCGYCNDDLYSAAHSVPSCTMMNASMRRKLWIF